MALQPGDTLLNGQYRVLRQLGRSGFGFVYLAQDTLLGDRVAIKELIPALVGDETILKRFLTEARRPLPQRWRAALHAAARSMPLAVATLRSHAGLQATQGLNARSGRPMGSRSP